MFAKEVITIAKNCTGSPKSDPRVFVTFSKRYQKKGKFEKAILILGVTGSSNETVEARVGDFFTLGDYEFRLLTISYGRRDGQVSSIMDGARNPEHYCHQCDVSIVPINYQAFEEIFETTRSPGTDTEAFNKDEIEEINRRLLELEKSVQKNFANNPSEREEIHEEFERLRTLLHSLKRRVWYDVFVGVLTRLATNLGVELVELCSKAFSSLVNRFLP